MASSKTPNLGLNIWADEDYVLREEFNENHQIIDESVGHAGKIFLGEIVTTVSGKTISVDVSNIPWGDYSYVIMDVSAAISSNALCFMKANGEETASNCSRKFLIGSADTSQATTIGFSEFQLRSGNPSIPVRFIFPTLNSPSRVLTCIQTAGLNGAMCIGYQTTATFETLSTFDIATRNTSYTIYSGAVFKFWGIR